MDRFIRSVVATADHVKALKRSDKSINISFDEWNVWYIDEGLTGNEGVYRSPDISGPDWPVGPRVAENIYSVADAVVVGSLLITLLKHADRVTSACLSMLVNSMAPIRAEKGGPAWRQTTFYPFALTSGWARGISLDVKITCGTHETSDYGSVPMVDAAATYDAERGEYAVFAVNRSTTQAIDVRVDLQQRGRWEVREAKVLHDADPYATNSPEDPLRVVLQDDDTAAVHGSALTFRLPPVAWGAIRLAAASGITATAE